ncbi:recombinase family protein [Fictibacillus phosphorivorans]|uniref:recombinase family protein n=1 Tax=Fictibacillus phosphorivorans TaxID=1221500 RepID=UPI002042459D|nr:recombinase family protein [Fictibacillus phosphorivorans]MCM3718127.1 recombinase family protein [Fictibacillus phosphorivorans]MCM3775754.1 recombinase family protein [Fictibacillus phosphorivorans]
MEIKKVAIYARVSTEEQASEGYSISAQLQTLRQYANLYGWEISNEYVDEGISGKSIKGRPAMQRLVADIDKGKFQAVLVWKISRLSRNMLDTLVLLDQFEENDVKFISYSENFDTGSPIGRLVVQLMASIAEMERNTLSENVKLGMTQRAKEGSWNGGLVFGYDSVEKELMINQKEAAIVTLIFEKYSEGKGLKAIANFLNKAGYKTKHDRHFSINGIATILDNPVYIGKIRWLQVENWDKRRRKGKNPNPIIVDGKHDPIITTELWSIVQARRQSKSFKQRQSNEPFLLSSILRCPDCGQGMVPSITTSVRKNGSKHKHRYYVCGNFHNKGSSACKANSIRAYEAEESVINRLENFLADSKLYIDTIESLNKQTVQSTIQNQHELEKIEEQLNKVNTMQEKYMEAFEQNLFPIAILQERLQKLTIEKKGLEQKKNELSVQLSSSDSKIIPPDIISHLLKKYLGIFKQSSREKKKQLYQLLLNNITIKHSNGRFRTVDKIELDFDFSEVNLSKTFTLIHILSLDSEKNSTLNPDLNDKMPPYLQLFLPLFMVRFTAPNIKLFAFIYLYCHKKIVRKS